MKHLLFLVLLLFFACKNQSARPASPPGESSGTLPEGFTEFYQKFHSDSLFQIEHITFPLQGLPDNADSATIATDTFHWQAASWLMQRAFDFEMSEFRRELIPVNELTVVERIIHKSGEYAMVRRFYKTGGEWQLSYYAGMNRLRR